MGMGACEGGGTGSGNYEDTINIPNLTRGTVAMHIAKTIQHMPLIKTT